MRSSARQAILRSLRSLRPLKRVKKVIPNFIKSALIGAIAGGRPGTIELGDGIVLSYPLDDSYWSRVESNIRSYEPELWLVLGRLLNSASLFIDCGANIGLWSCFAAVMIGNGQQVVAIEPGVTIFPYLLRNSRETGLNFVALTNAAWNKSGESMVFFVSEGHASSSLVKNPFRKLVSQVSVETVCIDDVVESAIANAPNVSNIVVKLDVEGVECEVIAGAGRSLCCENVLRFYEDPGYVEDSEATELCLKMGLQIYFCADGAMRQIGSARDAAAAKIDPHRRYNSFACRRGSEFETPSTTFPDAVACYPGAPKSDPRLQKAQG